MGNKSKVRVCFHLIQFLIIIGFIIFVCSSCGGSNDSFSDSINNDIVLTDDTEELRWQDIFHENKEKTVLISAMYNDGSEFSGSGFFIKNNVIVTNYHVVEPTYYSSYLESINITLHNSECFEVIGVDYSLEDRDIAFLHVPIQEIEPVIIGDFKSLLVLDEIMHIGNPLDLSWSANTGVVSSIRKAGDISGLLWIDPNTDIIQHNISSDHGSSGGIIINANGEAIAILCGGYEGSLVSGEFRFGISTDYIKSKIDDLSFIKINNDLFPDLIDNDEDGYTKNDGDCDDYNANSYPGALEICGDTIDQDCDGSDLVCSEDSSYEKIALLKGSWHFYYTIIIVFDNYYYLDDIEESTSIPGDYNIFGTDEYGDPVVAHYSTGNDYWSLLDSGFIIDRFYIFYTDGYSILDDSCYYQIDTITEDWSRCYDLNGYKVSSTARAIRSLRESSEAEKIMIDPDDIEPIDDSTLNDYLKLKQLL